MSEKHNIKRVNLIQTSVHGMRTEGKKKERKGGHNVISDYIGNVITMLVKEQ